jgi:hypothetical protein
MLSDFELLRRQVEDLSSFNADDIMVAYIRTASAWAKGEFVKNNMVRIFHSCKRLPFMSGLAAGLFVGPLTLCFGRRLLITV